MLLARAGCPSRTAPCAEKVRVALSSRPLTALLARTCNDTLSPLILLRLSFKFFREKS